MLYLNKIFKRKIFEEKVSFSRKCKVKKIYNIFSVLRPFFFGWIILLISFGLFPCKWFYDNFCSKSWRIVESRWRKYEYYLCQPGEFSETPCSWIALNICSIKQKVFFLVENEFCNAELQKALFDDVICYCEMFKMSLNDGTEVCF